VQEIGAFALGFAHDNNSFAGAEFGMKIEGSGRKWEKSKLSPRTDGMDGGKGQWFSQSIVNDDNDIAAGTWLWR
jgi:hypothetical protein